MHVHECVFVPSTQEQNAGVTHQMGMGASQIRSNPIKFGQSEIKLRRTRNLRWAEAEKHSVHGRVQWTRACTELRWGLKKSARTQKRTRSFFKKLRPSEKAWVRTG